MMTLWTILLLAGTVGALGQEESLQLDKLVDKNVVYEYDAMNSESIAGVLDASLTQVKVYHLFDKNCHSKAECGYYTHLVMKCDDTFVELTGSNALLPGIVPDFKMKSKAEAKEFEEMLDVVFPVFSSHDKEIYQEGNAWVFIREESFGDKTGVVVMVDGKGTILSIEDNSSIERNTPAGENSEVE